MVGIHSLMVLSESALEPIGEYLLGIKGSAEVLRVKLDKLTESEFEAGIRALVQASCSEREFEHLLREARSRFNKAVSLESGARLTYAFLGLAVTHIGLGDAENSRAVLRELLRQRFPIPQSSLGRLLFEVTERGSTPEALACHEVLNEVRSYFGMAGESCGECGRSTWGLEQAGKGLRRFCVACEPPDGVCPACHGALASNRQQRCGSCSARWHVDLLREVEQQDGRVNHRTELYGTERAYDTKCFICTLEVSIKFAVLDPRITLNEYDVPFLKVQTDAGEIGWLRLSSTSVNGPSDS